MNNMLRFNFATGLAALASSLSFAQDNNASGLEVLEPFEVIGSKQNAQSLVGTGTYLDASDLSPFFHTDINEILNQVPGVYARGEEGYGLFPNVSIRGVYEGRSSKVTLLEDGIPSSPSPYSDPSAYYSPTAGRMQAFEVLKGSSSLRHGPQTTGGVLNYISTAIPTDRASHVRLSYGENNERIGHIYSGGSEALGDGTLGYLVEVFDHRTDGWKTINGTATHGAKDGEIAKSDLTLKLGYTFGADNGSYLEFKAGRTDLDGDVSYIGLSKADYEANPYQRYAATRFDNMDSDQTRYYLRFLRELTPDATLSVTGFYNNFNRNWYKISKVHSATVGDWVSVKWDNTAAGVADTKSGVTTDADTLGILKGTGAGEFKVKNNDRSYYVTGIQANLDYQYENHDIDIGFRITEDDYEKNAYTEDTYTSDGAGTFTRTAISASAFSANVSSEALEVYLVDEIDMGDLKVTPGVRYTELDYWKVGSGTKSFDDVLIGAGATYTASDDLQLFGGVHQGHALPGPSGAHATVPLVEETSLGIEIGARGVIGDGIGYELAYFHTAFEDLIVYSNDGAGTTAGQNGEATSQGLEATIATDLNNHFETGVKMPTQLTLTYTDATFDSANGAKKGDVWSGSSAGNDIPYIPDLMLNLRTGVELDKTSIFLNFRYSDESYVDAANTAKIGKSGILDLSAFHNLTESAQLFGKITNLTDEVYTLGRLPDGYRVGAPRAASIGLKFEF